MRRWVGGALRLQSERQSETMGLRMPRPALLLAVFSACAFLVACGGGGLTASPLEGAATNTQNPLVAQYSIASPCAGQAMVEFGPDTSYGRSTSWYPVPGHYLPTTILVAGMRASTTYHMRSQVQCAGSTIAGGDTTFTTGALPASIQLPTVAVAPPTPGLSPEPGVELLSVSSQTAGSMALDLQGNVIWYCPGSPEPVKPMQNGHFIMVTGTDLREVDLACNVVRDITVAQVNQSLQSNGVSFTIPPPLGLPGGSPFHHDVLVLPNGHWIGLCQIAKDFKDLPGYPGTTQVAGDALVDIDPNGNVVWAWSAFDHLDVNRHLDRLPDWTHSNGLVYLPDDGNLLLSMRHQSWVLKVRYENGTGNGDVLWRLGYEGDFALTQNGVPTDDPSVWFSFQHFPSLISQNGSETTLAIWDNGDNRVLDTSGTTCGTPSTPACYSRATIFQVDESAKVANLVWDYLPGYFSIWGGSINQLPNGNVEFDLNAPAVPPSPNVAAEVQEVTQSSNPQVVQKMDLPIPYTAYRAYRIPSLYPGVTWQQ